MLIPQLLIAIIDVDKYASLLIPHKLLIIYKELAYSLPHKTRLLKHRALQLQNKHKGKAEILQRQEAGRQACEGFSAGKGAGGCLGGSKQSKGLAPNSSTSREPSPKDPSQELPLGRAENQHEQITKQLPLFGILPGSTRTRLL